VRRVTRAIRVCLAFKELRGPRVKKVIPVRLVLRARVVSREFKASRVIKATPVQPVLSVPKVIPDRLVPPDRRDQRVISVPMVRADHAVSLALQVPQVQPVLKVKLVPLVRRASVAKQEVLDLLVNEVFPVPKAIRVIPVPRVQQVPKVTKAILV
jgi:hypothetical protein